MNARKLPVGKTSLSSRAAGDLAEKPKHEFVYLLLTYGDFDQAARLIRTLQKSSRGAAIVLHHDGKNALPSSINYPELEQVHIVSPRVRVTWGDGSFLDATLACMDYIESHIDYSWVTFLSGQDYPLQPLSVIEGELRRGAFDAYLRAFPATEDHYAYRYRMKYFYLPRFSYAHRIPTRLRSLLSALTKQVNRKQSWIRIEGGVRGSPYCIGIRAIKNPFSADFKCFKGSDWFTLSQRAIAYLLNFKRQRPEVLAYFRRTFIPSESYVPTVLMNSHGLRIGGDNRRFVSWNVPGSAHPKTLTIDDLPDLKRSGKDFARKFDTRVDSSVLDELDKIIFGH